MIFRVVSRTLLSFVISVHHTPIQPYILSSEMQMNEAHPGCHMFKLEQPLFVWNSSICFVCICSIYLHFIYFFFFFSWLFVFRGKFISYNFLMDFIFFTKLLLKKILWLQALLGMQYSILLSDSHSYLLGCLSG